MNKLQRNTRSDSFVPLSETLYGTSISISIPHGTSFAWNQIFTLQKLCSCLFSFLFTQGADLWEILPTITPSGGVLGKEKTGQTILDCIPLHKVGGLPESMGVCMEGERERFMQIQKKLRISGSGPRNGWSGSWRLSAPSRKLQKEKLG